MGGRIIILIAEDDPNIRKGLVELLEGEGYDCIAAEDGVEAIDAFSARPHIDFVMLDIMMPKKSGYDVCREIRKKDTRVPVMFLSAKSEEIDKVVGLELGADDYVQKPFMSRELLSRIRAICRRALGGRAVGGGMANSFQLGELQVFPADLRCKRGDEIIELSLRETKILETFHARLGEALDRDALFDAAWGTGHMPNSRTLDQAIVVLRKKVERDAKNPRIICTVHGVGYRVER